MGKGSGEPRLGNVRVHHVRDRSGGARPNAGADRLVCHRGARPREPRPSDARARRSAGRASRRLGGRGSPRCERRSGPLVCPARSVLVAPAPCSGRLRQSSGTARRAARLGGAARTLSRARSGLIAVAVDAPQRAVAVYAAWKGRLRLVGGGVEGWRKPSRISWGDVDGDGSIEALVLVTGRARFDRRLALRPFVYGWDGRRLYPKWLGSRLSRPFDDATLGDLDADGRDELVAVEHTRDGRLELAAYRWRGFGFERTGVSAPASHICGLSVDEQGYILAVADGVPSAFRLSAERIEPVAGAGH